MKTPSLVDCIDDVDTHFRAVRTLVALLGWCQEMPHVTHVDAATVGEASALMMDELLELQEALERLKQAIE